MVYSYQVRNRTGPWDHLLAPNPVSCETLLIKLDDWKDLSYLFPSLTYRLPLSLHQPCWLCIFTVVDCLTIAVKFGVCHSFSSRLNLLFLVLKVTFSENMNMYIFILQNSSFPIYFLRILVCFAMMQKTNLCIYLMQTLPCCPPRLKTMLQSHTLLKQSLAWEINFW